MERGERRKERDKEVSVKEAQQDVFTVKLLRKRICSTAKGQTQTQFLFSPLNECMGSGDRLMQPSPVTLPSHHSLPLTHTQPFLHRFNTHRREESLCRCSAPLTAWPS